MKKYLLYSISFFIVMIFGLTNLSAANTPALGGKLSRGVRNLTYYIEQDSLYKPYESVINGAAKDWKGGNNPINGFTQVSNNLYTDMDFYAKSSSFFLLNGTIALTRVYAVKDGSSQEGNYYDLSSIKSKNWYFAKIFINNNNISRLNTAEKQGTMAHEMGHAMGLEHNSSTRYSIMNPAVEGENSRLVNNVQEVDNVTIRALYN